MNLAGTADEYLKFRHGYPAELLERLKQYSIGVEGQHVLDLGTANGLFARDLANQGCRVTGIDLSPELIDQARQVNETDQLPIEYLIGNVEHLPFDYMTYKVVTAAYCWHWFNSSRVAEEVHRVLENNGRLAIIDYDWIPSMSSIASHTQNLINEFNHANQNNADPEKYTAWRNDLLKSGFSDVETFSIDVMEPYSVESWMGRIQASPEIGGALSKDEVDRFNVKLAGYLRKETGETFDIPYRAFVIIATK
ncbi:class I SAM-dependent methyltransferase [Halobacillus litoralis]|uniref:class I SAM-dependent methyltransferase n=1 Tax=Halobacillus litoralis TaxID=45668 RepID=UPI0013E8D4E3|nr:class I SAM-dependent methyltransferase [Halobacillus litoralis]